MEPDAIKKVLDDFLSRFEDVLRKHVDDMRKVLEPNPQADAAQAMLLTTVTDMASDVGDILTALEDRNGL